MWGKDVELILPQNKTYPQKMAHRREIKVKICQK